MERWKQVGGSRQFGTFSVDTVFAVLFNLRIQKNRSIIINIIICLLLPLYQTNIYVAHNYYRLRIFMQIHIFAKRLIRK